MTGRVRKPVFELDGGNFDSLEGFFDEVSRVLGTGPWGRNLDAFNDVLRGGFGTPEGGFVLRWVNSATSRTALGYAATIKWREQQLQRCHPESKPALEAALAAARRGEGETVFDVLLDILRCHGPGGDEEDDGVELDLR